jgi:spoIIIJ-associated protein
MLDNAKSLEFEGCTVEDAINKALQNLKVSRETIKIKVLSEEQRGLFGMEGAKPAKIRVTIKEKKIK